MSFERLSNPSVSDLDDVLEFEKALANASDSKYGALGTYFDTGRPIIVVRAPARLDCMGGIADYSGATVCELPLDLKSTTRARTEGKPVVELSPRAKLSRAIAGLCKRLCPVEPSAGRKRSGLTAWIMRRGTR